ncbi:hypothetical protein LEMA_P067770.1 [Plenodomus lingam JN3]|uniref:DUF7514 domain-containing protein n=1 Tax=Leptosphaeria maculans (strain JN3 / isolate v23.1.3 / race Av1-4-5-6-7-8) TaxID=985895 RepID=E4ZIZ9_LEPMJ|nr:hypothetical protein LEMA_P067770.1 [Plenodomus lingam JN3]CBX91269.1 hypothetical protein LEMA_P067770.1 [Plenodomus lingam JN3]
MMAPESKESKAPHGEHTANLAHADASYREAYQYWGYLFKEDKCGTPLLDRLLKGIAETISRRFEPSDSPDLTPSQMAAWYRDVGGDYDVLFMDTPSTSIAFIYRSLGAFHSLQPGPTDDGYSSPTVPALKKQGFVTWQTIQLLLGPEDHVPFLQRAVEKYDVVDPETGNIFPKILPKECFPDCPDDAMEAWYQGVAARLKREAEEEANGRHLADQPRPRASTDTGDGSSADERHGAFKYFEDPMYRNARQRPPIMRHVSKQSSRPVDGSSRTVTSRVRHMLNPWSTRRKSVPGHYESDSYSEEDITPIAPVPPPPPPATRYTSHQRPHPPHQSHQPPRADYATDSDSDPERVAAYRRRLGVHAHRSHDVPPTQPEYFADYAEARRYSHQEPGVRLEGRSSSATSPQPVYRPTQSPLFATQVAHMQARKYHDYRPTLPPRTGYTPAIQHGVRWGPAAVPVTPPRNVEPGHRREREREGRDGGAMWHERESGGSSHHSRARRRRSTEDATYPRERGNGETARTRSHDRVRDDWAEREGGRGRSWRGHWDGRDGDGAGEDSRSGSGSRSGSRSRERERERERRTHSFGGQIMRFLKEF